jgi:AcrR family transcriptional regulator
MEVKRTAGRNANTDRRSLRSRQALSDALIAPMMEKSYDAITVQDIINRANVGRSTFYAHYHYKDDLLSSEFGRLIEALSHDMGREGSEGSPLMPSLALFRHVQERYPLYKALVWGDGLDFVTRTIQRFLSESIERKLDHLAPDQNRGSAPHAAVANYVAGAFLTLLRWWLDNNMAYSAEQMNTLFQQLVTPGVQATLGVKFVYSLL